MRVTGISVKRKDKKRLLVLMRTAAYQGSLARESPCLAVYYYQV